MSKRSGDHGYAGGWCIHYRYNRDLKPGDPDTCEAGVDYASWDGIKYLQRPCFLDRGQSRPGAAICPQIRRPTEEEMAAHGEWIERRMDVMRVVMVGIGPWREAHRGKSVVEVVECPACKGRLHLSISAYNGHIHGHCETVGCVSWME